MKNYVVENYENYQEENRLTTNNARKIEFITTTRILDEHLEKDMKILDCAAGTGVYAFYFADKGYPVTAADITPRHVDIINRTLKDKKYQMQTAVLDATDMGIFGDGSFDVVLNMGPFYHLTSKEQRQNSPGRGMWNNPVKNKGFYAGLLTKPPVFVIIQLTFKLNVN